MTSWVQMTVIYSINSYKKTLPLYFIYVDVWYICIYDTYMITRYIYQKIGKYTKYSQFKELGIGKG